MSISDVVAIILPDQLFYPYKLESNNVIMLEETKYFSGNFHKSKLVLMRAAMKTYVEYLKKDNYNVKYEIASLGEIIEELYVKNVNIIMYDIPSFHSYKSDLQRFLQDTEKTNAKICFTQPPLFFISKRDKLEFNLPPLAQLNIKDSFRTFYTKMREKYTPKLVTMPPLGGYLIYESKKKCPPIYKTIKNSDPPILSLDNEHFINAKKYVEQHYGNNIGEIIRYPINNEEALIWFKDFTRRKLRNFGNYCDSSSRVSTYMNHSVMSACLNLGLITPDFILEKVIKKIGKIPLINIESFVRHLMWREYTHMLYARNLEIVNYNHFSLTNKITPDWYNASTKNPIINLLIKKAINHGYLSNYERGMFIGSYMLLNEINPKDMMKWFSEMTIDNFCGTESWVVSANVVLLGLHNLKNRPHISNSRHILKMSNYKAIIGVDWVNEWNALFENFIRMKFDKVINHSLRS
jgi:deoxyribodipyrimidine photolyase-related protein